MTDTLRTARTFTREQVADLISRAFQSGYDMRDSEDLGWQAGYNARVAEENAAYPPEPVFALGKWFNQATERAKADAAARLPRPGDFKGREASVNLRVAA